MKSEKIVNLEIQSPRVALIAHDNCKTDMVEWCKYNVGTLTLCKLYATGTTGSLIKDNTGLKIECLLSGPLGGDAQVGSMIAEGKLDCIVFFWDALSSHAHDVDVKMLLRLAVLYNVAIACNRSSADYLISSPMFLKQKENKENKGINNGN